MPPGAAGRRARHPRTRPDGPRGAAQGTPERVPTGRRAPRRAPQKQSVRTAAYTRTHVPIWTAQGPRQHARTPAPGDLRTRARARRQCARCPHPQGRARLPARRLARRVPSDRTSAARSARPSHQTLAPPPNPILTLRRTASRRTRPCSTALSLPSPNPPSELHRQPAARLHCRRSLHAADGGAAPVERASLHLKPAASYSPGLLRAKYHRR